MQNEYSNIYLAEPEFGESNTFLNFSVCRFLLSICVSSGHIDCKVKMMLALWRLHNCDILNSVLRFRLKL